MQANASVVAPTPEIQTDAPKPEVSTMDTSERSARSEIKVEDDVPVSWYDQVVAVEEALQGQAHGSQTQMPGETNSQLPGPHTGSESDNEQTD